MSNRQFRAKIHVISTAEGGRKTPFLVGYRPQFHIAASKCCTSFMISKIEGSDRMYPGETGVVEASLLSPEGLGVPIEAGTEFELREGNTAVAPGMIENYI